MMNLGNRSYCLPLFSILVLSGISMSSFAYGELDETDREFDSYVNDQFYDDFKKFDLQFEEERRNLMQEFEKKRITLEHDFQIKIQNLERDFQEARYNLEIDFIDNNHDDEVKDYTKHDLLDEKMNRLHDEYNQKRNDLQDKFHDDMEDNRINFKNAMGELNNDFNKKRMQTKEEFTADRIEWEKDSFGHQKQMDYGFQKSPDYHHKPDPDVDREFYDMNAPEFKEMKHLKEKILAKFSMEEIENYWKNGDKEGLLSEILARTDLTEEQVRKMFEFVDGMEDRQRNQYDDPDKSHFEERSFDNVNRATHYDQTGQDSSQIRELEQRIDQLEQENYELQNYIDELEKKIDGFNKVLVEQMQVIYDWVTTSK